MDLLDASAARMRESLEERVKEGKCQLSSAELDNASTLIGFGAVKYFDLKQHPESDYIFSYDKMLDTKGNTAVSVIADMLSCLLKLRVDVVHFSGVFDVCLREVCIHRAKRKG